MGLSDIRKRMVKACDDADRAPEDVELIAVSKVQPEDRGRAVLEEGQRVFGENKVQEAQTLGPSLVLVTRGAEGSFAFPTKGNPIKADAVRATVVDTVGAGDTFNAGFLAKLSEFGLLNKTEIPVLDHGQIKEALDFANLAASVTVSRSGANPPWRDDLNTSD